MPVADIEIAGSVVGILSPVLSALILALVTYLIRTYLPEHVRDEVEKSVNESEAAIKAEIQNGITDRLDHIVSKVDPPAAGKTVPDSEVPKVVPDPIPPVGEQH